MLFVSPGEAQCIDRLMEAFAQKLFTTHSESAGAGHFKTADAVYVLAFSTIILNTDLHNPNLNPQKKMSCDQFVANNRGINDNSDIPKEYLQQLYRDIQGKQIQVDLELADMVGGDGTAAQGAAAGLLSDKSSWAKLLDRGQQHQVSEILIFSRAVFCLPYWNVIVHCVIYYKSPVMPYHTHHSQYYFTLTSH